MATGKLVLGVNLIDTGPCTDNQQANMGEIANLLDAMGNPGPIGPIGPEGPTGPQGEPGAGVETYNNVYVNEDGDLVYTTEEGDIILVDVEGSGTFSDAKTFYNLVWGSITYPNYPADQVQGNINGEGSFGLRVASVHDAITVHVPKDQSPNPSPPVPTPLVGDIIVVSNSPRIRTVSDDVVYARYNHAEGLWDTDCSHNWTAIARGRPDWDRTKRQVLYHDYAGNTDGNSADAIVWWEGEECTVVESIDETMQVTRTNGELEWKITYTTKDVRILRDVTTDDDDDVEVTGTFGATECP